MDVLAATASARADVVMARGNGIGRRSPLRPHGIHNAKPIDAHNHAIQAAMGGIFHELGLAA